MGGTGHGHGTGAVHRGGAPRRPPGRRAPHRGRRPLSRRLRRGRRATSHPGRGSASRPSRRGASRTASASRPSWSTCRSSGGSGPSRTSSRRASSSASGVPEPLMATLTRIGTVEGYGANIRLLKPQDLQKHFVEDVGGTAIDHLGGGLFEAHGRDEAGWDEEAGHKDMWFAARDIAFDRSCDELDIEAMLARMGFGPGRARRRGTPGLLPADVSHAARDDGVVDDPGPLHRDLGLPHLRLGRGLDVRHRACGGGGRGRPARVLHPGRRDTARRLPADRALGDAGPHLGRRGRAPPCRCGHDRADLGPLLAHSLGPGRDEGRRAASGEVEFWCARRADGADILAEFHSIGAA